MFNLSVRIDIRSKDFESKMYFFIFLLVAVLLAFQVYNVAYDVLVAEPSAQAQNIGVFKPRIEPQDIGL